MFLDEWRRSSVEVRGGQETPELRRQRQGCAEIARNTIGQFLAISVSSKGPSG